MSVNDPINIKGLASIFMDQDQDDIDLDAIEDSIIGDRQPTQASASQKQAQSVMQAIEKDLKYFESMGPKSGGSSSSNSRPPPFAYQPQAQPPQKQNLIRMMPSLFVSQGASAAESDEPTADPDADEENDLQFEDPTLAFMTDEKKKQAHLERVFGASTPGDQEQTTTKFLQDEQEEDEMIKVMEKISTFRRIIEAESDQGVRDIPNIDNPRNLSEARRILKMLKVRVDSDRGTTLLEEVILGIGYLAESYINGKNVILGGTPDLTGYTQTLKIKLMRLRGVTTEVVSNIIKDFEIPPIAQILMEIIPSMLLYIHDRNKSAQGRLTINEDDYDKASMDLAQR